MTSASARVKFLPALVCAVLGGAIFQFLGNSTRGYVHSSSLFYWWSYQWINPASETQHGLLILAISAWLLVRNLRSQGRPARDPSTLGLAAAGAMLAGLLVHVAGYVAEQARLSIIGLLLYAWGVAAAAGGGRWARASAFPLAFMIFAVPMSALDSTGFWLRMGVVRCSAALTHALGIPVIVNGTQLLSPDGTYDYDVAAACSGVRSLVALSALSLLIGYLRFKPAWLRAAMLALSFPLIFVGNVARIVAIVIAARAGGQAWGDRVHELMGFGVFAIVLGGVFAAAEAVARIRPGWALGDELRPAEATVPDGEPRGRPASRGRWAVEAAVPAACLLTALFLVHLLRLPPRGRVGIELTADGLSPVELPTFIGTDWIGRATAVTSIERELLPPDTGFSRKTYVSFDDPKNQAFLSIVLSGRDRSSIHRPELCLVGQGWTILGSFAHQFTYPDRAVGFPSTVLKVEREVVTSNGRVRVPQLVAYYFVGGDSIVSTHWERLAKDAWNRLVHGRADRWAYVLIQTGDSDGDASALRRIQTVLDGALPVFQKGG